MFKRAAKVLAILSVPFLLALNVAQAYRYTSFKSEIESMEAEQRDWLENNKRLITAIAALKSPERIAGLAADGMGLKKAAKEDVLRIEIDAGREDGGN